MTVDLSNSYLTGSKAYLEIMSSFPPIIDQSLLSITASRTAKNPLVRNYVFYSDVDTLTPLIKATEQSWEPKFSGKISYLFLSNVLKSLRKSMIAWKLRREQERVRQAKFDTDEEAMSYGWHIVEITVRGVRMMTSAEKSATTFVPNITSPPGPVPTAITATTYTMNFPLTPAHVPDLERGTASNVVTPLAADRRARSSSSLHKSKSIRQKVNMNTKKIDEYMPSTSVEVILEDRYV
jgi:hypothetical protein